MLDVVALIPALSEVCFALPLWTHGPPLVTLAWFPLESCRGLSTVSEAYFVLPFWTHGLPLKIQVLGFVATQCSSTSTSRHRGRRPAIQQAGKSSSSRACERHPEGKASKQDVRQTPTGLRRTGGQSLSSKRLHPGNDRDRRSSRNVLVHHQGR